MKKLALILLIITPIALMASYEEAVKLFQEQKYEESLKILGTELDVKKDLEKNSPNYNIRYLAAHNHWNLGNEKSALAHFKRCMEIKKDSVDPYIDLAIYYFDKKQYVTAYNYARKGLKVKEDAQLNYLMGEVSLAWKKYYRAKTFFEKANALNPELYFSYNQLGVTHMHLKQYREANTAFSIAAALNSKSIQAQFNLAVSFEVMGEMEKAKIEYEKALELDEDNEDIKNTIKRIEGK